MESLILTFDWRRLNDVTWFRKCWYHKGLVEALFMGRPAKDDVPPHPSSPYYDQNLSTPSSGMSSSIGNINFAMIDLYSVHFRA